jgi:hypothetical protein
MLTTFAETRGTREASHTEMRGTVRCGAQCDAGHTEMRGTVRCGAQRRVSAVWCWGPDRCGKPPSKTATAIEGHPQTPS